MCESGVAGACVHSKSLTIYRGLRTRATKDNSLALQSVRTTKGPEHPPGSSFEVFSALWSNWRNREDDVRAANPLFSNCYFEPAPHCEMINCLEKYVALASKVRLASQ